MKIDLKKNIDFRAYWKELKESFCWRPKKPDTPKDDFKVRYGESRQPMDGDFWTRTSFDQSGVEQRHLMVLKNGTWISAEPRKAPDQSANYQAQMSSVTNSPILTASSQLAVDIFRHATGANPRPFEHGTVLVIASMIEEYARTEHLRLNNATTDLLKSLQEYKDAIRDGRPITYGMALRSTNAIYHATHNPARHENKQNKPTA